MKIESLFIQQMRGLPLTSLDFRDPVTGRIRQRTVIAGSNGSGKTTILETIYELLEAIKVFRPKTRLFDNTMLRMVIRDLPSGENRPLLLSVTPSSAATINISYTNNLGEAEIHSESVVSGQVYISSEAGQLPEQIQAAEAGNIDFPNCLYFPSEGRQLRIKKSGQVNAEPSEYKWMHRFSDTDQWSGSLESFLVALYFRDLIAWHDSLQIDQSPMNSGGSKGEFERFIKIINSFLMHKQITGVNKSSFRVEIQADDDRLLNIDNLSSGEKQLILLLGEIQRRIRQGSILLIDEPEIHLHPRWQRLLVRVLTDLCAEYDAQLIITTQSQEIADAFYEHELILLDDIFEKNLSNTSQSLPPEHTPEMTAQ